MRVVLDTCVLVSSLIIDRGFPSRIYRAWLGGLFTLLTCEEQLDELRETLRKPAIAKRFRAAQAGRMMNQLGALAEDVGRLPRVKRSPDPTDDFLLAMADAGKANYLVTGDKCGLLILVSHRATRIVSVREFAEMISGSSRRVH